MATWRCIQNCGACCHLDPKERPNLEDYLSDQELKSYLEMVGEGGWCIHFDHQQRTCKIYARRPSFCRVESQEFQKRYGVELAEFNDFAIDCCHQQITGVYGNRSEEMRRYNRAITSIPNS